MTESWSKAECEAIVIDYLMMLVHDINDTEYNKTEHRKSLQKFLNNRSNGSIEYKHQNISAVLIKAGHVYIKGYKPAWNYQSLMEEVVLEKIESMLPVIEDVESVLADKTGNGIPIADWGSLFVVPPERIEQFPHSKVHEFTPRYVNYSVKEAANRTLGLRGEEFVLDLEKARLSDLGREDLLNDIE